MIFSIEQKRKDAPAMLSDTGAEVTYGELCCQAEQLKKIIDRHCLLFCMCKNMPGAVVGYIGALESHAVPLLLDADLDREQFEKFFQIYEPAFLWAPAEWGVDFADSVEKKMYEAYGFCLWKTNYAPYAAHPSLGLLLATSGSTGSPKLVQLSLENVMANAASIREYLKLTDRERPITTLPLQYTYGLSIINSHLLAGACILMTRASYVQKEFWDFFENQGATSFGGVPYTYEILKKMHIFQKKMPSLTSLTQAGGKLSASLQEEVGRWAAQQGISFYIMYGQTEATARMSYLPPEKCLDKIGSIGIAIPGGAFLLTDEDGNEISEPGQVGELVYRGKNVSLGYAEKKEDLLNGDVRGGVLHTEDLAKRDKDGYYYIVGRKKRFLKIFGIRVSLDACEQILREWYPTAEFACAGSDGHMKIYAADRTAAREAPKKLSEYLHLSPRAFEGFYLPKIPKNTAGKIQYAALEHEKGMQL